MGILQRYTTCIIHLEHLGSTHVQRSTIALLYQARLWNLDAGRELLGAVSSANGCFTGIMCWDSHLGRHVNAVQPHPLPWQALLGPELPPSGFPNLEVEASDVYLLGFSLPVTSLPQTKHSLSEAITYD